MHQQTQLSVTFEVLQPYIRPKKGRIQNKQTRKGNELAPFKSPQQYQHEY